MHMLSLLGRTPGSRKRGARDEEPSSSSSACGDTKENKFLKSNNIILTNIQVKFIKLSIFIYVVYYGNALSFCFVRNKAKQPEEKKFGIKLQKFDWYEIWYHEAPI